MELSPISITKGTMIVEQEPSGNFPLCSDFQVSALWLKVSIPRKPSTDHSCLQGYVYVGDKGGCADHLMILIVGQQGICSQTHQRDPPDPLLR